MEYKLKIGENVTAFRVEKKGGQGITLAGNNGLLDIDYTVISDHRIHLVINGTPVTAHLAEDGNGKTVIIRGIPYALRDADAPDSRSRGKRSSQAVSQIVTPPMPAVVVRILVSPGDRVKQDEGVIVVSSMKMETTLLSPFAGTVKSVNAAEGDKVMPGQILIDIDKDDEP
ncbi:MAG TPA: acetyl-CoA carboxylase biotin carboxyl carrier protein subunit [Deltaproteobacteria bacterium]|nr:acetyl-CoA carboxylase biotin carboxyl carrier protein subunit [Deltaproteobacteria bacterium]HQI02490.1 acetyl-CoA carboxylase biotin carboxyl carrier protein subunit [Deltaproteobacteria bacterium]HQJ09636.1 acetyl-CoA carboxylase biotin carboxyl carrier protein subunit [Deltaproteobacteria bacterium]